ncbi:serine/threonine receptor-like kinase NFP [Macadamia integrifolia]|uniref:serine/threonine receptor-like kinase NFP n=1 Tax=Macadamia integrifolia TaxID=60698 RepID=UPI001C4FD35F|nr:serine/threonine receptor-like kinase NFP [Macadamia integrifolia]
MNMIGVNLWFSPILLLLSCWLSPFQAQDITSFKCSDDPSYYPCQAYVFYQVMAPDLTLTEVSDLFCVSRLMISRASNISSPSSRLLPNQKLFVPVTCSCNSNGLFYANIYYTIQSGNTFFDLSHNQFQNFTTYQSVEFVNPSLVPINLTIGSDAIFPIFCNCPNTTQMQTGINHIISYVYRPSDTIASIAATFGLDAQSIIEINGQNINPWSVIFLPVSQIPQLDQPYVPRISKPEIEVEDHIIIGLAIGLGISLFLLVILILLTFLCCNGEIVSKLKGTRDDKEKQLWSLNKKKWEKNFITDVSDSLDKYGVYDIRDLRQATAGFNQSCLIEGSVYKGCIGGEFYAIKRMKWNALEELKILQKVNHGNLVKLKGFCIHPEFGSCYLVYEYVENDSLYSWLHEDNRTKKLDWKTRLRIAIDVANGLQYIHEHTRPTVVHKDIKTSNILLDGSMRAKIANFGLAKSGYIAVTKCIIGTHGYIAPEYLTDGTVTTKMDVFSFGVVLLELVSGKEAINEEGKPLSIDIGNLLEGEEDEKEEKLKEWMDKVLLDENPCSIESIMNVVTVAISCVEKDPSSRPTMVDIVYTLSKSEALCFDYSMQEEPETEIQQQ